MAGTDRPFAALAGAAALYWIEQCAADVPGDEEMAQSCAVHDALAVAVVDRPRAHHLAAGERGGQDGQRPHPRRDHRRSPATKSPPPPNCEIATAMDAPAFMDHLLGHVEHL